MSRKCIICGGEEHVTGTTEYEGEDYPIHEECYRTADEGILQERIKEARNKNRN